MEAGILRFRSLLITVAAAVTLVILGCGGGDGEGDTTGGTIPSATQAPASTDAATGSTGPTAQPTDVPASGNQGSGASVEACSLLTAQEVSEALAQEVAEGKPSLATNANASACEWSGGSVSAILEVLTEGGAAWYESVNFGQDDEPDKEPVEGIGDKAVFDDIGVLDVLEGDRMLSLQIILFFSEVDELEAAKSLAQIALDRLP
jgi:hypothetical protein